MTTSIARWRVGMLFIVILLITLACTDRLTTPPAPSPTSVPIPDPLIIFPQQEAVEGERTVKQAETIGELILANGCLRLNTNHASYLLVWPPDFAPGAENDVIHVLNRDGQVVASVGDEVYIGGGETRSIGFLDEQLQQQLPTDCPGPYWIVGDEVRSIKVEEQSE